MTRTAKEKVVGWLRKVVDPKPIAEENGDKNKKRTEKHGRTSK